MKNYNAFQFRFLASILALSFAVSTAFAGGMHLRHVQDTIKRSFDVRSGGTLYIDIDQGDVEIETSSDNRVYVVMERDVEGVDRDELKDFLELHDYRIDRDRSGVLVESRFNQEQDAWRFGRRNRRSRLRLEVTVIVPEEYNVEFRTGAGNVEIAENERIRGYVEGRTGAGNIDIGRVEGSVELTTGSGNINVEGARGQVRVRTGAGTVRLARVEGEIQADTGAGDIEARLTSQPIGDSRFSVGAGNVTVYLGDDVAVNVDAHASVGSADCEFGLEVKGKWMSKSFEGEVNGGGPALTLRSGVGNVALRRM